MSVQSERLATITALGEPLRRSLYLYVAASAEPVSRDRAAQEFGVSRGVAAFHLDKLAELGLVGVEYRRPPGRTGPGAGRPAKLYRGIGRDVSYSLPPREYEVAGRLLAEAVTTAGEEGIPVAEALGAVARRFGRTLGRRAREVAGEDASREAALDAASSVLNDCGYEPRRDGGAVALANCPFHALAQEYRDLVCNMNLELMVGFSEELESVDLEPRLEPVPGQCCVRLATPKPAPE